MKMYYALHHHQVTVQPHVHQLQGEQRGVKQLNMMWYRNKVIRAFWVQMTVLACFLSLLIEIILTITGSWFLAFFFISELKTSSLTQF